MPLRWVAAARPDFYQKRLVPLLQDMGHHALRPEMSEKER
jgi:hypothetical protein